MLKLTNYEDVACEWGYMTLCEGCKAIAPASVNLNKPLKDFYPADHCEICKKKGVVTIITAKCPQCDTRLDGDPHDNDTWYCPECDWPYHGGQ